MLRIDSATKNLLWFVVSEHQRPIRHEYGRKADPSLGLRMTRTRFPDCDTVSKGELMRGIFAKIGKYPISSWSTKSLTHSPV
jgi:hypothetical protein